MLAIYYMAQDQYETARHLLSAANHIFQEWQINFDSLTDKNEEMEEKVIIIFICLLASMWLLQSLSSRAGSQHQIQRAKLQNTIVPKNFTPF